MFREYAEILSNELISKDHYLMRLRAPRIASDWIPGQFINVLLPYEDDRPPLLRRPFSILESKRKNLEFVYRVVGCGTKILSEMRKGQKLDIIGPLGKGFPLPPDRKSKNILICGGVGAPPIFALSRLMLSKGFDVDFYFGAKDRDSLIFYDALCSMSFTFHVATEDGSIGHNGLISEILPAIKTDIKNVFACGPVEMLKAIYAWHGNSSVKYYASVESKMGCGVGVCLGCSIPSVDGKYLLTCRDGPVFDADLINWEKL